MAALETGAVMRLLFALFGLLATLTLIAVPAFACPGPSQDRIRGDAKWCFGRPQGDGFGDLVVGSCNKDADKTRNGFRDCQHDGSVRDNYDSCTAGEQIDAVRAAGRDTNIYSNPAACGF